MRRRISPRTRIGGFLVAGGLVAALAWPAGATADSVPGAAWSEHYLASKDGTSLHADVFRPRAARPGRRLPVLLVVSPYLGLPTTRHPSGPPHVLDYYADFYAGAVARGYAVVQVSLRGTGASGGCGDLGGTGDQGDVVAALAWARSRPWSSGRIGMFGHSYDGYTALVGLARRPGQIAAAAVMAPSVSHYRALFMNGVPYLQTRGVAAYYQSLALVPFGIPSSPGQPVQSAQGRFVCTPTVVAAQQSRDASDPFWRQRDLAPLLSGSRVPVLWTHGFLDGRDSFSAVRPDNFLGAWRRLRGPRRAWFGQWSHVVPGYAGSFGPEPVGRGGFVAEELRWFDRYVRRGPIPKDPPTEIQSGSGAWHVDREWPPADARRHALPQLPGSYVDAPGNEAEQGQNDGPGCFQVAQRCNPAARPGIGSWTFTQPAPYALHLAGNPRLTATIAPQAAGANLIAIVYDVDENDRATMISRGASLLPAGGTVAFDLYPQDWTIRRGHRIGLLLTGSDDGYFVPASTFQTVRVTAVRLALPFLRYRTGRPLSGGPSRAVRERTSFKVAAGTIAARVRRQTFPPRMTAPPPRSPPQPPTPHPEPAPPPDDD